MKLKFNMALMLLMVAAVAISSCGNDDDENGQTSIQTNTWLIDGRLFIMNDPLPPEFTDGRFNASGIHTDGNSLLSIFFPVKPTSSGTYNVVSATTNIAQLGPNECTVGVNNTFTPVTIYGSTGKTGDRVSVTVSGGKVTAEISRIEMFYFRNSTRFTVDLSAKIREP